MESFDTKSGERFVFFRAKLRQSPLPVADVASAKWQTNAVATMMDRYQREYSNNQFGLYIGDGDAGEVHHEHQT